MPLTACRYMAQGPWSPVRGFKLVVVEPSSLFEVRTPPVRRVRRPAQALRGLNESMKQMYHILFCNHMLLPIVLIISCFCTVSSLNLRAFSLLFYALVTAELILDADRQYFFLGGVRNN